MSLTGTQPTQQTPARESGENKAQRLGKRDPKTLRRDAPTRRWGQWVAAVLALCVFSLAAAWLYASKGSETEMIQAVRDVPPGQVITREDLGSVAAAGVEDTFAAADVDQLIGQVPVTGLVAGQVITHTAVASASTPAEGERVVSALLPAGRVPADTKPGDVVDVIAVPAEGQAAGADVEGLTDPLSLATNARVLTVDGVSDGSRSVSLIVKDSAANQLAAFSASNRVAIITAPQRGASQ